MFALIGIMLDTKYSLIKTDRECILLEMQAVHKVIALYKKKRHEFTSDDQSVADMYHAIEHFDAAIENNTQRFEDLKRSLRDCIGSMKEIEADMAMRADLDAIERGLAI